MKTWSLFRIKPFENSLRKSFDPPIFHRARKQKPMVSLGNPFLEAFWVFTLIGFWPPTFCHRQRKPKASAKKRMASKSKEEGPEKKKAASKKPARK